MTEVPGLPADVAFGAAAAPLPDWRKETADTDDPATADEPDDHSALLQKLFGYDAGWWEDAAPEPVGLSLADLTGAAADVDPAPSEAQKRSGNYQKGHLVWKGLPLTIETAKGQARSGTTKDGKPWSVEMQDHYGYVKRTESEADGDHVDVFVSEDFPDSDVVFVVNQLKPDGSFDEHKCILGQISADGAKAAYLRNYSDGWTGFGSVVPLTLDQFKAWLADGDTSKALKPTTDGRSIKLSLADDAFRPTKLSRRVRRLAEQRYPGLKGVVRLSSGHWGFDPAEHPRDESGQFAEIGERIAAHVERHRQAVAAHADRLIDDAHARAEAKASWQQHKAAAVESIKTAEHATDEARRGAYLKARREHVHGILGQHRKETVAVGREARAAAKAASRQLVKDVRDELRGMMPSLARLAGEEFGRDAKLMRSHVTNELESLVDWHHIEYAFDDAAHALRGAKDSDTIREAIRDLQPDVRANLVEVVKWQLNPEYAWDNYGDGVQEAGSRALRRARKDGKAVEAVRAALKDQTGVDFDPGTAKTVRQYVGDGHNGGADTGDGTAGPAFRDYLKARARRFAESVKAAVESRLGLTDQPVEDAGKEAAPAEPIPAPPDAKGA